MLALLDSLLDTDFGRKPDFDLDDQGRRFLAWQQHGAYTPDGDGLFDIGGTTSAALRRLAAGTPAVDAGPADEGACGNGSLMRILPVALVGRDLSPAQLIERAHLASRVTHGHPRCQVACAVYCVAVVGLLRGQEPGKALAWALAENERLYHEERGLEAHLVALEELRAWPGRQRARLRARFVLVRMGRVRGGGLVRGHDPAGRRLRSRHGYDRVHRGRPCGRPLGLGGDPDRVAAGMRGREIVTPLVDRLVAPTGARTSTASPLRVDLLDLGGIGSLDEVSGRVGITFLPGKKRDGWTGPHWRDLDADLARLLELGVDALFLLVEDSELESCLVTELPAVMAETGPELIRYPIRDPRIPTDDAAFRAAVLDLIERIRRGQFVAIACRGGIDRSGMTAACLLREVGIDADEAIRRVQARAPWLDHAL